MTTEEPTKVEECPTPTKTPVESNATNAAKNETKEAPPKADAEEEEKSPKADAETDEDKNDTIPIFVQCLSGAQFKLTVAPTETVMEIRQIISESVEGCYVTSFNLVVEVDGSTVVLDDYAEIREQPIKADCTLKMSFNKYDDKGIRHHVQRLMELIDSPLSDIYLATASFTTNTVPNSRKDRSYPSFMSLVPDFSDDKVKEKVMMGESVVNATFHDFEYALDVKHDVLPFVQRPTVLKYCTTKQKLGGHGKKGRKEEDKNKSKEQEESDALFDLDGSTPLSYLRSIVSSSNANG